METDVRIALKREDLVLDNPDLFLFTSKGRPLLRVGSLLLAFNEEGTLNRLIDLLLLLHEENAKMGVCESGPHMDQLEGERDYIDETK